MRYVDRSLISTPPKVLSEPFGRPKLSEIDKVIQHRVKEAEKEANDPNYKKKSFTYSRYKQPEVKAALTELFFGKCAYCETFYERNQPVDVEHYRPKNGVDGYEGGYWWLGMDWDNLLPSCIDCNRKREQKVPPDFPTLLENVIKGQDFDHWESKTTGKSTAFPLLDETKRVLDFERANDIGDERPLLIDPCRDDPADYISFFVDDIGALILGREETVSEVESQVVDPDLLLTEKNHEEHTHKLPLISLVVPNSTGSAALKIAKNSILIYGLNRLGLVQSRTKVLRDLEFLYEMSISLQEFISTLEKRQIKQHAHLQNQENLLESTRNILLEGIATDEKVIAKMQQMNGRILDKIKAKTAPEAEYSALAQSWLRNVIEATITS